MKIRCPHCGVSGSADDSFLGRKVKCPKCKGLFPVELDVPQVVEESPVVQESLGFMDEPLDEQPVADEAQDFADMAADLDAALSVDSQTESVPEDLLDLDSGDETLSGKDESLDWDNIQAAMERELLVDEETEELTDVEALDSDETEQLLDDAIAEEVELLSVEEEPELLGIDAEIATDEVEAQEELSLDADEDLFADTAAEENLESAESELDVFGDAETPAQASAVPEDETAPESEITSEPELTLMEEEPPAVDKERCFQCGKEDSDDEPFIAKDGRLYCTNCLPADEPELGTAEAVAAAAGLAGGAAVAGAVGTGESESQEETSLPPMPGHFTIGGALREAWEKTKGAKGPIWGFSAIMYLVVLVVFAGVSLVSSTFNSSGNVFLSEVGGTALQFIIDFVAMIFTAGLLYMGVKRAIGKKIQWKQGFTAFSYAGRIIVATVLQTFMLLIGFLLLILPGIYLSIAYAMTLPLIVDRGMGAWEAMEESRKAVHKVWWRVLGLYVVVGLIVSIAMLPLGLGLIWVWPMVFVLAGVVYRHLFGTKS